MKLSFPAVASLVLFVFVGFVGAGVFLEEGNYYISQNISEAWNLIPGISFEPVHPSSELPIDTLISAHYFDSRTGLDRDVFPVFSPDAEQNVTLLYSRPFWVFSLAKGVLVYKVSSSFVNRSLIGGSYRLYPGANHLSLTPEMRGKLLSDLAGNCTLVAASRWDSSQQVWVAIDLAVPINFDVGAGLAVNVSGECNFMRGFGGASCSDGIQNQGELGVDCGGPCVACDGDSDDGPGGGRRRPRNVGNNSTGNIGGGRVTLPENQSDSLCNLNGECDEGENSVNCPADCSKRNFRVLIISVVILIIFLLIVFVGVVIVINLRESEVQGGSTVVSGAPVSSGPGSPSQSPSTNQGAVSSDRDSSNDGRGKF